MTKRYKRTRYNELRDVEINYRGRSILVLSWSIALSIMILSALAGIDIIQTGQLSDNTATFLLPIFTGLLGIVSGFVASKGPALAGSSEDPQFTEFESSTPGTAGVPAVMTAEAVVEGVEDEDDDEDEDEDDFIDDEDDDDEDDEELLAEDDGADEDVDPITGIPVGATSANEEDPGIEGALTSPEFGGDESDFFDEDDDEDDEFADIDFDVEDSVDDDGFIEADSDDDGDDAATEEPTK